MDEDFEEPSTAIRPTILEMMVHAALGGHDLGEWEALDSGWQAQCKHCGQTTWIGDVHFTGFVLNRLDDICSKETTI